MPQLKSSSTSTVKSVYRIRSVKVEYLDENGRISGGASTTYLKEKPFCANPENVFMTVQEDIDTKMRGKCLITVATNKGSFKKLIVSAE